MIKVSNQNVVREIARLGREVKEIRELVNELKDEVLDNRGKTKITKGIPTFPVYILVSKKEREKDTENIYTVISEAIDIKDAMEEANVELEESSDTMEVAIFKLEKVLN